MSTKTYKGKGGSVEVWTGNRYESDDGKGYPWVVTVHGPDGREWNRDGGTEPTAFKAAFAAYLIAEHAARAHGIDL